MSVFGDNLKKYRIQRGLTKTMLAEIVGLQELRITTYELGNYTPSLQVVERLANALNISAKDLLGKEIVKKPRQTKTPQELSHIDRSTFGGNLKYLRNMNNMSMSELAAKIDVAPTVINSYENAGAKPSSDRLIRLAEVLGVTVKELMVEESDGPEFIDDYGLDEYLEELRERPEIRPLFSLSKNATKEDVDQTIAIIQALTQKHDN